MVKIKTNYDKEFLIKGTLSDVANVLNNNKRKYVALMEDSRYIGKAEVGIKYFYSDSIMTIEVVEKIKFENIL